MGMTGEKEIKILEEIIDEGWLISDNEKCIAIDACEFAIDRIRKYQKIEGIINNWKDATFKDEDVLYAFHKIKKVVEDGKID